MNIVVGSAEKIIGADSDNWDFPIAYVAKIASEGFDLDDVPFMLRSVKTSIPYFVDEHKLEPQSEYSGSLKEALKIAAEAKESNSSKEEFEINKHELSGLASKIFMNEDNTLEWVKSLLDKALRGKGYTDMYSGADRPGEYVALS